MTGTEGRLADALAARAEAVDPASVRPLPVVPRVGERRAKRRHVWLAPVAAAVSATATLAMTCSATWPCMTRPPAPWSPT